jgi:PEP-CTERM motif
MGRQTGLGAGRKYVAQRVGAVVALAGLFWATGGLGDRGLQAASITVVQGNGNTVFDNSTAVNQVDFDVIWSNNLPVQLEVQLDAGDTGPTAFLSGFHVNLTGGSWGAFDVELQGGPTWGKINPDQVTPGATGGLESLSVNDDSTRVNMLFAPPIADFDVLTLGAPNDVVNPGVDWSIALNGVGPGQSFGILLQPTAAAVPEPTTLALAGTAAAVGLAAAWRRRRRRITT